VPAILGTPEGGGSKRDFKFDRDQVQALFCAGYGGMGTGVTASGGGPPIGHGAEFALHLNGTTYDGDTFAGRDTSRVIHQDDCEGYDCEVTPQTLDFGTVGMGTTSDLGFTITNTGTKPMIGAVLESCPEFDVVTGGGPYLLNPGEMHDVTVRFAPTTCGSKFCNVSVGCSYVTCTGEVSGESCEVVPSLLDFGQEPIGGSSLEDITITNTGCSPLSGNIQDPAPPFSISSGGGPFTINPGESHTVMVLFQPTACGVRSGGIGTGLACANILLKGEGTGSGCKVNVASLDFGTLSVGDHSYEQCSVANTGCVDISGTATLSGPDVSEFSIYSGASYNLQPSTSQAITVKFEPTSDGVKNATLNVGTCGQVQITGNAASTNCSVSPATTFDYGTVAVGDYVNQNFTITNTGSTVLSGTPSESCPDFEIWAGGGFMTINPGDSHILALRFGPISAGAKSCTVDLGLGCGSITLTGTGQQGGMCQNSDTTVLIGPTAIGSYEDDTFGITNSGTTIFSGYVELPTSGCDEFSIVSGEGMYTLTPGEVHNVTVRYAPTACDSAICTITTGCLDVQVIGTPFAQACVVDPQAIDFGTVAIGNTVLKDFTITNGGCTVLSGQVSESCDRFDLTSDPAYTLLPGESKTFYITWTPDGVGLNTCTIDTGSDCIDDVYCSGAVHLASSELQVLMGPSNSSARFTFGLNTPGEVSLKIYDAAGRLVRILDQGHRGVGGHTIEWNLKNNEGRKVNAGIYFVKLVKGERTEVQKAMVVK
jgi:hypothetical protein